LVFVSQIERDYIGPDYRGDDVVRTLESVCARIGYPKAFLVFLGSEFISHDRDLWAYTHGVTLNFDRPGKSTDNAFIKAFNGRFRVECLNAHWCPRLRDAREMMEDWRGTITRNALTGRSGKKPRQHCLVAKASTDRLRDRRRKLYSSAVQSSVSEQWAM